MTFLETEITQEAQDALTRATLLHLFDPNVALVDLGLRIRDREKSRLEDELCVRVHLVRKPYGAAFDAFAARYPDRVVDSERIGFSVDVPQADYRIQWWSWYTWYSRAGTSSRAGVFDPMRGGISVSNALRRGYGTLGGKVRDRQDGREMILSNWHVLASWAGGEGTPVYQPGRGHGGGAAHTVAHVTRGALDQNVDAAVAELSDGRPLINDQLHLGPVSGAAPPRVGMRVVKSGCGSGVTSGIVSGIGGHRVQYYDGIPRVIGHNFHIVQTPEGGEVSRAGDSGSWWLDESTNRAVGLHFVGSDVREYAVAMEMPQVLDALNVTIAS